MRSLHTTTKSSPRSLQLEKARAQQRRPKAAKKKEETRMQTHTEGRPGEDVYKPRREASGETNSADTLILDF